MDIMKAMKVAELMRHRDVLLTMRTQSIERENQGWSIGFNDIKFPILKDDKQFFREAIGNALDQVESEIEKL